MITPYDDPIEGESLVGAAKRILVSIRTKPGVVDLGSNKASLVGGVDEFAKVEDLLLFVGTKEKDVDEISLGKFRAARVPNERGVLMLQDTSVCGRETGIDVVARVDLAIYQGLVDPALVSYHLPSSTSWYPMLVVQIRRRRWCW
jgi:hypothetical protein